jgi:hypothetical protein
MTNLSLVNNCLLNGLICALHTSLDTNKQQKATENERLEAVLMICPDYSVLSHYNEIHNPI